MGWWLFFLPLRIFPFEIVILALGFLLTPLIVLLFSPLYWDMLGRALGLG